jgi:hypothetical protein
VLPDKRVEQGGLAHIGGAGKGNVAGSAGHEGKVEGRGSGV